MPEDKKLKSAWTGLGHAFKTFGKTFVRSAKTTAENVDDWANKDDNASKEEKEPNSTVYSDGSWKKTGKELGHAFKDLGDALIDKADDIGKNKDQNNQ